MKQINNLEELKRAQIELRHKIELKELELAARANAIKRIFNPMTYINLAISKISFVEHFVEHLAESFFKGYEKFRQLIARYRHKDTPAEETDKNQ